jgi:hypothetical protein
MVRSLVLRGLAAGAVAGVVSFVFAWILGEPLIQAAIDYEGARDAAQQALNAAAGLPVEPAGEELFSRAVQGNLGIGIGLLLFGLALGALFAVAFCLSWGRLGNLRPRSQAMLLALGGFVTLYLVPFLKYPANPPAVSHDDTIGPRTGLYLVMVVGSVVAALIAVRLGQALAGRFGAWNATLLGIVGFVVLTGVLMAVLPSLGQLAANVEQYGPATGETPQALKDAAGKIVFPGFDPDLLYDFRLYSVLSAALTWAVLGLTFAPLAERAVNAGGRAPNEVPSPR